MLKIKNKDKLLILKKNLLNKISPKWIEIFLLIIKIQNKRKFKNNKFNKIHKMMNNSNNKLNKWFLKKTWILKNHRTLKIMIKRKKKDQNMKLS